VASVGAAVVALATGGLLAILATRQALDYDSIWHVFIARQADWPSFWQEVRDNAHPPLFYVLLKGSVAVLGTTLFAYRAVSILATVVSVILLARVAVQVTANAALAIVAAAAFGLSATAVELGLEVRAYAVLLAALLMAFSAYVDWLSPDTRAPARARAIFGAALSVALLTHYSSFFFLAAALAALGILYVSDARWRARLKEELTGHRSALIAMFGVPIAVAAVLYFVHLKSLPHGYNHVSPFLYDRHTDSVAAFIFRSTRSLVGLFVPDFLPPGLLVPFVAVAAAVCLAPLWLARGGVGSLPTVLLTLMLLQNIAAALLRRYPYGGDLRHESYLFPFILLSLTAGIDCIRREMRSRWSHAGLWVCVAGLLVAMNVASWPRRFTLSGIPFQQAQMDAFRSSLGAPPAVLVDQYNFIPLFGQFHDWQWRLRSRTGKPRMWQVWDVSKGGQQFAVCRNREWQVDLSKPEVYFDVAECLGRTGTKRVGVYRPQQPGFSPAWPIQETKDVVNRRAAEADLVAEAILVSADDVYASFVSDASPGASGPIAVVEATYGGNCRATAGNATTWVRGECEGRPRCTFLVEAGALGDPAPGCAKDFVARWTCEVGGRERRLVIGPEAGWGSVTVLSCSP